MNLPTRFKKIISLNQAYHGIILDVISSFEPIFQDNKLYFFEEYTDHGINHIEKVLESAEFIITDESFEKISPNEVLILVLSIILHDLGMHVEFSTFNAMLKGEYDSVRVKVLDEKTWVELWNDYLNEVKRFSTVQKKNIFGNENFHFKIPDLTNKDNLTGFDKKLIGEFIRRHHGRFAHEIALSGLKGGKETILFGNDKLGEKNRELAGILARSHSMNLRDTFVYLEDIGNDSWRNPQGINIVFLMVILRIADYIQIDSNRVNPYLLKIKTFNSPVSQLEHDIHLSIVSLNFNQPDSEKIYADCNPSNSEQFVKINNLILDIQSELDKSWASLGEVYGFIPNNKPSIKFRRITSNLENKNYLKKLNYVPEKIGFKVDNNLSKLLVAPLYGDNPTFGVRELIQNAVDSCLERKFLENQKNNFNYSPLIKVFINRIDDDKSLFTISDNGKGMDNYEIINYFLNVGTSFRKSMDWKKRFIDEEGKSKINRNGKFGIGVLASFLLGNEINVKSKSLSDGETYSFQANINSQFINLSKQDGREDYGVEISIEIDNDKRDNLLYAHSCEWTQWYIYDEPKIYYIIDNEQLDVQNNIAKNNFFEFSTSDFDKISWNYISFGRYWYKSDNLIACNGIVIKEGYEPGNFDHKLSALIRKKPSILVTDKEGIFPVKLDRNDIDCEEFPFEKELFVEVCKHFIAQLLSIEIDLTNIHKSRLIHNPKIIFGSEGYFIDCDYFTNGVKNLKPNYIRIITEASGIRIDLKRYKNSFYIIEFNKSIKIRSQSENVAPSNGARVLLSTSKYDHLFSDNTRHIDRYAKSSSIIEERNERYILYTVRWYNKKPVILTSINDIDPELLSQVISIQEVTASFLNPVRSGDILIDLFSKYIKNNYIIPYDFNKRKEIYKEAFRDLKNYFNL